VTVASTRTSARTLGIGLALLGALTLTGCIPFDAGRKQGAFAINESDVPVVVSITGTEFSAEASRATGSVPLSYADDCIGDGVVVKDLDGNLVAIFDGAVCNGTTLRIYDDWTIAYSGRQGRTESEPAIPMPTTPAPTPTP